MVSVTCFQLIYKVNIERTFCVPIISVREDENYIYLYALYIYRESARMTKLNGCENQLENLFNSHK